MSVSTISQQELTADLAVHPADCLICIGKKLSCFSGFPSYSKASHVSPRFQCLSESLTFYTHCLNLAFVPSISKPGERSAQLFLEATTAEDSFLFRDFCIPASLTTEQFLTDKNSKEKWGVCAHLCAHSHRMQPITDFLFILRSHHFVPSAHTRRSPGPVVTQQK